MFPYRLRSSQFSSRAIFATAALILLAGCGRGGYSGPTGTVSGKVTLDGKTAPAGCNVSFLSDKGFAALGSVGPDGTYSLAMGGKSAIPAVSYKVAVTSPAQGGGSDADYDKYMSPGGAGDGSAAAKPAAPPPIPPKYADSNTSGLVFEVKAGANTFDIDLK